jgi:serine protease Do
MNTRARTIASLFTVAMAAMLLAAVVTTQIQRPSAAQARPSDSSANAPTAPRPQGPLTLDTFKDIARLQTQGVVNINTTRVVRRQQSQDAFREFFGDDLMERFFGPQGTPRSQSQTTLGSGFIIDKAGYVLTNRHVVEGAEKIYVSLQGGRRYDAKLVGRDSRTDVALVKIEPTETLTVLNLGDSDQTEPGEWVMAIGNPFGLGGNSVTVGVVSFKGRTLRLGQQGTGVEMIQTDASINPGNSGGPLLNAKGEVIGINTLIITRGLPQSSGVGFAVPINVAKDILPQLREKGKVIRGWIGVSIQAMTEEMAKTLKLKESKGALVSEVSAGSPAEKAGLKPDDVVLGIDGKTVEDSSDLSSYIASRPPGSTVRLRVWRDGAEKPVAITLGTFPDQPDTDDEAGGARKGQLGMTLQDLTPAIAQQLELPRNAKGVVVTDVEAGEAAETAGLQPRDVIVSVNGNPVDSVEAFEAEIAKANKEGLARLRVRTGQGHRFVVLRLK